jgi:hypothetical protein
MLFVSSGKNVEVLGERRKCLLKSRSIIVCLAHNGQHGGPVELTFCSKPYVRPGLIRVIQSGRSYELWKIGRRQLPCWWRCWTATRGS